LGARAPTPYYAQRILAQPLALAEIGAVAAAHHERLDGSGYHRSLPATMPTPIMRILAAAEVYQAISKRARIVPRLLQKAQQTH
jgi:HD-GYP domain-containing protein (c-di-GMP phosphodiesterase class II)